MPQQKAPTLLTIFSEVLADLAFMFTDDVDPEPTPGEQWLEVSISYDGEATGTLYFRCPRSFSQTLAANLLGTDPNDDEADSQAEDAAKEFMNIVCGQLVTAIHGTEHVFNLAIPQLREMTETPSLEPTDNENISTLAVDGQPIQLEFVAGT
jgi:chemotaxis protein CheY-P-specific phosphatase CheC